MKELVPLVFFAVACSDVETMSEARAIRGGVEDSTDTAVVYIADDASGASCTGALIGPKVVLTAQHCVAPIIGPIDCATTLFGAPHAANRFYVSTRTTPGFNPSAYVQAAEISIPPGEHRVCGQDVALIVLSRAADATPIEARLAVVPTSSEAYSAIGYGATSSAAEGSGTRRRRDQLTVECVGTACGTSYVAASEWLGNQGICIGDSGGPAVDSSGRVIGVASRGAFDCSLPVYALLTEYAEWIDAELARVSGVPPDAGIVDSGETPLDAAQPPSEDAAAPDSGEPAAADASIRPDAGTPPNTRDEGCACSNTDRNSASSVLLLIAALALVRGRLSRS